MAETTDPTRWFEDLMRTQQAVLLPQGDTTEAAKSLAAAAAPWTKAFNDLANAQLEMFQKMTEPFHAWVAPWLAMVPGGAGPIKDRRFAGEAWTKDPRYQAMARTYLAQTEALFKTLDAAPMDERSKAQWGFALRQVTDALSPSNALLTNPEALQKAMETGGGSLIDGAKLFTQDLADGRISQTDMSAFEVGVNVGTTAGSVVFANDLFELIQYTPTTEEVYEVPLLLVPPSINKYYILDLQASNSFVGHAVAEGHTVFLVSWRNIGPDLGTTTWDDYLEQGVITAIDTVLAITKQKQANILGFCIGGTLLASALAVLAAKRKNPAASLTLLTTMLDFTDTGEIGLLVSEEGVKSQESKIGKGGVFEGKELANVFSALRANDLIWNYVSAGYLKGQAPPAFDMLFWNADSSNLPGPMYTWYVRNTYLENNLRTPGGTTQLGVPVDLGKVKTPTFVYASKEDHIVPWKTAYTSVELLGGPSTFVLGASGHIAGVINAPAKKKRNYWVGGPQDGTADAWFEGAEQKPGSWWPTWYEWLQATSGEKVPAPKKAGNTKFKVLRPAPGTYVKEQV